MGIWKWYVWGRTIHPLRIGVDFSYAMGSLPLGHTFWLSTVQFLAVPEADISFIYSLPSFKKFSCTCTTDANYPSPNVYVFMSKISQQLHTLSQ